MNRIISLLMVLPMASQVILAQKTNFNPTVQVTNDYDNRINGFDKTVNAVTVPDSLYKFDLNFDYTGFDAPYRGNDEFNPFRTDLEIEGREYAGRSFYMKAGAGYTLHPEFDLAWTFKQKGNFKAGLYAVHNSYFGDYWNTARSVENHIARTDGSWIGYEGKNKVGFDGRLDLDKVTMTFNACYDGVFARDRRLELSPCDRLMTSGDVRVSVSPNNHSADSKWSYGAVAEYRYGVDQVGRNGVVHDGNENAFDIDAFGRFTVKGHNIELEAGFERTSGWTANADYNFYRGYVFSLHPRYVFNRDRLSVGVGAALLFCGAKGAAGAGENFNIFPNVKLLWEALPGVMDLYVNADMEASTYGVFNQAMDYAFIVDDPIRHIAKNALAHVGIRGNVMDKFHYDVHAGYDMSLNAPVLLVSDKGGVLRTSVFHQNMNDFCAGFDLSGKVGSFKIKAMADYRCYLGKRGLKVIPNALKADVGVEYDYHSRFNATLGASYISSYQSDIYVAPGFVDLYFGVRYKATDKLSVYLKATNLLNSTIQYIPLYSQKGISVTAGIVLNF